MLKYPESPRHQGALFFAVDLADRVSIATSIERLIDLLDLMSPDADLEQCDSDDNSGDLEDGGDVEYSLGATGHVNQALWSHTNDHGDREDDGDDLEASVGVGYYLGRDGVCYYDLEADHSDDEPSLGWTAKIDQSKPYSHVPDEGGDREWDEADDWLMRGIPTLAGRVQAYIDVVGVAR